MRVPIALGIGAVLVMTVFIVLAGWEFLLEDRLFGEAEGEVIEYSAQRWKEVLTVTGISVLVLLFPMWLVHKNAIAHPRTGAALSEAEQRMQAILDNAPESVFLKDTKGRYVLVNRSFEQRLGVRAEDVLGKTLHDLYPKELADLYLEQERQVLESGETLTRELPAKWPDGSERTYLSVKFPVRSREGRITHVGTITTDITNQKAAEAALSEQRAQIDAILENASASISLKDTEGRYVLVNPTFEKRLGVRAEDAIGKTLYDFYDKDMADEYSEQERKVLETGETDVRETRARWPDGSEHAYLTVKFPIRSVSGEITHIGTFTSDMTDVKMAETELREQQARMQAILEHSPASIFMKDRDDRFVLANKTFAERLGTDIEGVIGKSTHDFYPEDLAEFYVSQDKLVLETGESVVGEFPTIWSDGSGHINLTVKFPVLDDTGEIMHVGTFTTDITEMRAAERKLRESEELLHAIIDNSPLTIYVKDLEGRYEILNRKFEEHIGKPIEEIIGKTSRDFFPQDLADLYIEHEREVIESGETIIRENKGTSREPPHDRQLLVVKFPIRDPNGNVKHVGTFTTDITELKAVEIALKESEARYRTLSEFASEAVFINDGTYIVDANSAAERMFGYTHAEFIGKRITEINAPEVRDMVAEIISRQSEEIYEGVALRKDGTTFEAEYQPRIIDYHGKPHRFVALRDISARKAMDRMKDELISIVSHELRTPLTSIRGSLGLAAGGVLGDMPEKARSMIDLALKNTERLTILVNRILDIEKATAGTLELDMATMDLGALVKDVVEANAGLAEEFKVTFDLGDKAATPVVADGERISQVVANLLSNAAKFSPAGGTVRISVEAVDGLARVRVADDGPGIPMEFQERLFDKFAQADSSDTRRTAGSGLGLYISKAIIEKHGGKIGFDTAAESGTTFYFTLPLAGGGNGNEENTA